MSSVIRPAHAFNQREPLMKRKANLVDSVSNDYDSTKRICQDTARSVEKALKVPVSTLRQGYERVSDAPRNDAYLSHPALHSAAATSMSPSMSSNFPSYHVQNRIPRLTCSPTSTFVAINRVSTDRAVTTHPYCPTSTHSSTLSKISTLPVASSIPSNGGQVRASRSLNSQCKERHGTTTGPQTLDNSSPPVGQVTLHHSSCLSQDNAATKLPSPPADSSELHHITGHNTDHGHGLDTNQTPGLCEATFEQCDLLCLLLRYLFPRVGEKIEVPLLLRSLEQVWARHEQDLRLVMDQ